MNDYLLRMAFEVWAEKEGIKKEDMVFDQVYINLEVEYAYNGFVAGYRLSEYGDEE